MDNSLAGLRHSARGCLNSIKLCASALELDCTPEEELEFINDVIRACDKMGSLMDELSRLFESQSPTGAGHIA